MVGKPVSGYVFKKRDHIVTMDAKSALRVGTETISIDPQLLFQRLVTASKTNSDLDEFSWVCWTHIWQGQDLILYFSKFKPETQFATCYLERLMLELLGVISLLMQH